MISMIAIGVSFVAFDQTKMSKNAGDSVQAQVVLLEKQSWDEWKNKKALVSNLSDGGLFECP